MAAAGLWTRGRDIASLLTAGSRYSSTSFSSSPAPLKQRIIHHLYTRFYDLESIINWTVHLQQWNIRRKNAYFGYTEKHYGRSAAVTYFVLSQKGGVRFQGQETWFRSNKRGKINWDFLNFKDVPVEEVDVSGSPLNYIGLDNLVTLKELKMLNLSGCPYLDDWCLSRLHVFKDSLEELSLAGCPQVTERGLATLHHLENLKRLDVSHLPSVSNKELIAIMMEEMLPHCTIIGLDYSSELAKESQPETRTEPQELRAE
ncbi:distal membrane-arm assembly complex protein 2 [Microcaecilia unicolor]|uniref:Distal membrane-arm assembly complex protein 2 n=1 Tax=Microcaecilia unicolor TaxID=1415580 RepID=A0A6P7Z6R6_9AMPH|nr:distal membrane-arm assembly complex protein 2 [Microcaecilia unicolor]